MYCKRLLVIPFPASETDIGNPDFPCRFFLCQVEFETMLLDMVAPRIERLWYFYRVFRSEGQLHFGNTTQSL